MGFERGGQVRGLSQDVYNERLQRKVGPGCVLWVRLGGGGVLDPQSDPPSSGGMEDAVHCSKPWSPGLQSLGLCVLLLLVFQVSWGPGYPPPVVTKEVNKAGGTNDDSK